MEKSVKLSLIIVGVAIVIIVIAVFVYPRYAKKSSGPPVAPREKANVQENNIGNALFEKSQNPISDKLPETNPFGGEVNPFERPTNPYKDTYKNPFK